MVGIGPLPNNLLVAFLSDPESELLLLLSFLSDSESEFLLELFPEFIFFECSSASPWPCIGLSATQAIEAIIFFTLDSSADGDC
jgi:hypothetical protein